jgi:hypothetical protein
VRESTLRHLIDVGYQTTGSTSPTEPAFDTTSRDDKLFELVSGLTEFVKVIATILMEVKEKQAKQETPLKRKQKKLTSEKILRKS